MSLLTQHIVDEIARGAELGLRQSEIAALIGVSPGTLSRWKKRGEEIAAHLDGIAQQAEDALKLDPTADVEEWVVQLDVEALPEMEQLYLGVVRELSGGDVRLRKDILTKVTMAAKEDPQFGLDVLRYLDRRDAAANAAIEVEIDNDGVVAVRAGIPQADLEHLAEQATRMQIERRAAQRAKLGEGKE
ncbi:MAG: helix-turn-helix domain-containing protein [Myxococcales bacterium]|nr:helix-turn-helix domain-containing protein [Myxococcales bacterium]